MKPLPVPDEKNQTAEVHDGNHANKNDHFFFLTTLGQEAPSFRQQKSQTMAYLHRRMPQPTGATIEVHHYFSNTTPQFGSFTLLGLQGGFCDHN